MHEADKGLEAAVFCGSLFAGFVLSILFSRALRRRVEDGRIGRFGSTVVQGVAFVPLCMAPMVIALAVKAVAAQFGAAIFIGNGGNDGALAGLVLIGMTIPFVTAALLAVVRLVRGESREPSPPRPPAAAHRPSTGYRDMFADLPSPNVARRRDATSR